MTGTPNQVEWAGRIKLQVDLEFQRVAASFRTVAAKQDAEKRAETEVILTIIEEKRAEVMSRDSAGYFIHDWQEITDQVRQMIFLDPRYKQIQLDREARKARPQVSLENKL